MARVRKDNDQRYLLKAAGITDNASSTALTIDSDGNLLVGTTSSVAASDRVQVSVTSGAKNGVCAVATDTSGGNALVCRNSSSTYVGGVAFTDTATSFPTSSDERLKENIVDAPAGNIDDIRVRSFDWKADGSHQTYGMIAQELVEVAPEAVSQGDMWAVDYSKLVPMMIKEIQDLKAEVAALAEELKRGNTN